MSMFISFSMWSQPNIGKNVLLIVTNVLFFYIFCLFLSTYEIREKIFEGPPPVLKNQAPPLLKKKLGPLPWAFGARPRMKLKCQILSVHYGSKPLSLILHSKYPAKEEWVNQGGRSLFWQGGACPGDPKRAVQSKKLGVGIFGSISPCVTSGVKKAFFVMLPQK